MNELQRILALKKEDRTESDLAYLTAHAEELSEEQKSQLAEEQKPEEDATENDSEEVETPDESSSVEKETVTEDGQNESKTESLIAKNIGKTIYKNFQVKVKELPNGHLMAVVNSGKEDRHGEILDIRGLDITEYMTNPILANGHDYSKPSVGITHKLIKRKDGSLDAEFSFATDVDGYDEPKILDQLYRKGYQKGFSIGFIAHETEGNVYTKSTMIEFSPVLIGADARALLKSKDLLNKKGIDNEVKDSHNDSYMKYNLAEILKKAISDLTIGEIEFLKEHQKELTIEQSKFFASVIEEKSADAEMASTVKALAEKVATLEASEKVEHKSIADKTGELHSKDATKEVKLMLFVKGLQSGNFQQYINVVGKAATDPMNTSNTSQVVPPAEFLVEIERMEEQVGIAARFATVRRSKNGAGLTYTLGDDDLEIYDTDEAGHKKSTSLTYKQKTLAWKKWAGILPLTDELNEDSAVDLWNDAIQRFSRAYAKKADQLVFTANLSGGNNKKGILYETGTNQVTLAGDSIEDITYEDLVDMIYGVPSQSANTGAFWLNRDIIPVLMKLKDDQNRPLWIPSIREGAPATILGKPYYEVSVLPSLTDSESSLPFMAFGDLRYVTLGERTDIQMKVFDTGTVGGVGEDDTEGNEINLMTQDAQALRAVKRMNAVVRFPEAFSVATTATGS